MAKRKNVITQVSIASGKVLDYLERMKGREVSYSELKKNMNLSDFILSLGLGWLVRQGMLGIERVGRGYRIFRL